jgi:hypothetical protein
MVKLTMLFILASIGLFLSGIGAGWLFARANTLENKSRLQIAVGIVVTIVWVVSIAAEIIIPGYTVSMLVHGIMGAVVGYLFSDDGVTFNIDGSE